MRGLLRWESRSRGRPVLRLTRGWGGGPRGVLVTLSETGRKKKLASQRCEHASCAIKIMCETADAGDGTPKKKLPLAIRPIVETRRAQKRVLSIPRAPLPVLTSADQGASTVATACAKKNLISKGTPSPLPPVIRLLDAPPPPPPPCEACFPGPAKISLFGAPS